MQTKLPHHILLFVLLGICSGLQGQNKKQDVLYLKNGSIIRGTLISNSADSIIRIKLISANELVIHSSEVESSKRERVVSKPLFEEKVNRIEKPIRIAANVHYAAGIHTSFGNTKTSVQHLFVDAGVQFRNGMVLSAGGGLVNYRNLEATKNMLINGKNDFIAVPVENAIDNSTSLNHLPVYLNLSVPDFKTKRYQFELFLKAGYFLYNPERFSTLLLYYRKNNRIVYSKYLFSQYLNRPFLNPGLNISFPTRDSRTKFVLGLSYFMDFLLMNYHYEENEFIATNPMLPSEGYWKTTRYTEKNKTHLNAVMVNIAMRF